MGFVEWLSPVIDMIIAPFKAIGNVIGGIIGSVKGWFGETAAIGETELARMNETKTAQAAARPVETSAAAPETQSAAPAFAVSAVPGMEAAAGVTAPSLTTTSAIATPALGGAAQTATGSSGSGNAALAEHLAAASRKGIAGTVSTAASDAFMGAGTPAPITPRVDMEELNRQAQTTPFLESLTAANTAITPRVDMAEFENGAAVDFQEAVRPRQASVETLWNAPEERAKKETPRVFNIQSVNLNADDIYHLLDFARQLEQAIHEPVEALV